MEEILRQDPDILETLQSLIDQGKTYQEISDILKITHSSVHRGLSAHSVRHFCASRGISKRTDAELDAIIADSVAQVYLYPSSYHPAMVHCTIIMACMGRGINNECTPNWLLWSKFFRVMHWLEPCTCSYILLLLYIILLWCINDSFYLHVQLSIN